MKTITLTRGFRAIVDDSDYDELSKYTWSAHVVTGGVKKGQRFKLMKPHVSARGTVEGRLKLMHRHILSAPQNLVVDHIDGDPLNNQRSNLRVVTREQNATNTKKPYVVKTRGGRWEARISVRARTKYLGTFRTRRAAISAWLAAKNDFHPLSVRHNQP